MSTATLPKIAAEPKRRPLHVRLLNREAPLGYTLLVPTMLMLLVFLAFPFLWLISTAFKSPPELGSLHLARKAIHLLERLGLPDPAEQRPRAG